MEGKELTPSELQKIGSEVFDEIMQATTNNYVYTELVLDALRARFALETNLLNYHNNHR